jgi:4-hydroxy-3-methylbut-2-enyl diphosphate reductase
MGVRRAMELVLTEANKPDGPLFTYGPLIHNEQVMALLESKGVKSVEEVEDLQNGRVVLRAHGIPPQTRQAVRKTGLKIVDATCPRVGRVQAIIRYYTKKGYTAIIVGDEEHPEVKGLMGYAKTPAHVIRSLEEARDLPDMDRVFIVAQTTQDAQIYGELLRVIKERYPEALVFNTICDATHHRQEEVRTFVGQVDGVVVVGGLHSGNTQRLAQVARSAGLPTFHVETEKDLDQEKLVEMAVVGVTAGASTPNWMIKNVVEAIENIQSRRELSLARFTRAVLKTLVLSNVLAASGAFCFAFAGALLSRSEPALVYPCLTFLYIYAMHALNRFLDKGASAYNDPDRARFHRKYGRLLIAMAMAASLASLGLSLWVGHVTFLALAALNLLGIIYSLPLIPARFIHQTRFSKIKDIPGSKTLAQALALVALITLVPLLEMDTFAWPAVVVSTLIVLLMGYIRSALFDLFQVQGDLIVGAETLPIILGEKRTLFLLKVMLLVCGLVLAVTPLWGLVSPFGFLMLLSVLTLALCVQAYQKRWIHPGFTFEALVEANFFLAGLLAILWQIA